MKKMLNIERKLKNQMEGYYYGQMNLLKGNFEVVTHEGNNIGVQNFYSGPNNIEVCHNQADFYKNSNLDLNLIRVFGEEPIYFNNGGTHCYLMLPRKELPDNFWELDNDERATSLLGSNPLVVDPSFKKVIPVANSGYSVRGVRNFRFSSNKNLELKSSGTQVPLGIDKNKRLVSFGPWEGKPNIFFREKFAKNTISYDLDSWKLNGELSKERFIFPIVQNISRAHNSFSN
ncbi:hypothetical protein HOD29_04885 [archaeon]|nr:hypothetical protein [archaeon]